MAHRTVIRILFRTATTSALAAAAAGMAAAPALANTGYECKRVEFDPATSVAVGHQCVSVGEGNPDLTGYFITEPDDAPYGCDAVETENDPAGGLRVTGTGCERDVAP
ncbi:hypothetical protein [Allonocardiopsis opalescens]|uniref:Secreted protein n=1 Tax=Allonocardiopsis opalescens TaxID=1144618 RepID=A0A2T0QEC5_9ACTN|nr:hypothetical protein [Allonocardiopsis opalescens]PRY02304.1 hypothetical protein CLV72_101906 [Allonocardiopsis opalescens]